MIEAQIRKSFAGGYSLEVELRATAGVTVLFGPSGAGKTLTLDSVAGFVRPDHGRILLDGRILFDSEAGVSLPPQRRSCGYVFQNYALFPHMTLRRNLQFAAAALPRLERHRKVNEMLDRFRLSEAAGRRPHELSGGQRQRCSVARALIGAPRLLLLDEPARGLDAPLRAELYDVVRQARADYGTPVLLVTHDLAECAELGDEMLVLHQGRIVQTGPPGDVFEGPANVEVARLLGLYNLLAAEVLALDPGRNRSRVRQGDIDLAGPYFPGKLIGDRVWLCIRPESLSLKPREGAPGPNEVPSTLLRTVRKPGSVRAEFTNGLAVELPPGTALDTSGAGQQWLIQVPQNAIRAL